MFEAVVDRLEVVQVGHDDRNPILKRPARATSAPSASSNCLRFASRVSSSVDASWRVTRWRYAFWSAIEARPASHSASWTSSSSNPLEGG